MRHLHRNRIQAVVTGAVPDLSRIQGVHDVTVDGQNVACGVDPEGLTDVLAALMAAGVKELTSAPPTLEEVFLDVYRPQSAGSPR
jgi:ABC-2 type transport system ATP-binding protein